MPAGPLRHRVAIEQKSATSDSGGGRSVTWVNVTTVWAEINPASGRERMQSEQVQAQITHRIKMRYRTGVTPAMRITQGSRIFEIRAIIDEGERRKWLVIECDEAEAA